MGTRTTGAPTENSVARCQLCGQTPTANCDWKQGRCPHQPSMLDQILNNPYRSRFHNLLQFIKKFL